MSQPIRVNQEALVEQLKKDYKRQKQQKIPLHSLFASFTDQESMQFIQDFADSTDLKESIRQFLKFYHRPDNIKCHILYDELKKSSGLRGYVFEVESDLLFKCEFWVNQIKVRYADRCFTPQGARSKAFIKQLEAQETIEGYQAVIGEIFKTYQASGECSRLWNSVRSIIPASELNLMIAFLVPEAKVQEIPLAVVSEEASKLDADLPRAREVKENKPIVQGVSIPVAYVHEELPPSYEQVVKEPSKYTDHVHEELAPPAYKEVIRDFSKYTDHAHEELAPPAYHEVIRKNPQYDFPEVPTHSLVKNRHAGFFTPLQKVLDWFKGVPEAPKAESLPGKSGERPRTPVKQ